MPIWLTRPVNVKTKCKTEKYVQGVANCNVASETRCHHRKETSAQGFLPLFDRFSLGIGLLFRGTLVLLPLPIIGPEWFTIGVDTLTSTIVISRTPEITLIAHLKGIYQNTLLVRKLGAH